MNTGATPPSLPGKPSNWLPMLIAACVFSPFLILLIVFASYRVSNASAVRRLEAEIKRKGEPLTLADLAATYPPIPDEDNGAVLLVELWKKEDPEFWNAFLDGVRPLPARQEPRWDAALPLLGADARRISRTTVLQPTNLLAAEAFLEAQKEHIELVRQALRKPKFRFPIVLTDGYAALLPHLALVKREAQTLHVGALLAIERGDMEAAIAAVEAITRTGSALDDEPLVISQLARVSCFHMGLEVMERLSSRQALSSSQLERLGTVLSQMEMKGHLRLAFVSERAAMLSVFDLPETALPEALSADAQDGEATTSPRDYRLGIKVLGAVGFSTRDRRLILETMGKAIQLVDLGSPEALEQCEELFRNAKLNASRFPPNFFSAMLLPGLEKAALRITTLEARRRAAMVSLAVERNRLAGNAPLPESLEQLVPQFLPAIPADPFDGEPIRYKKLPTGFVVYSIGPDRADDGGKERPQRAAQQNFDVTFVVER